MQTVHPVEARPRALKCDSTTAFLRSHRRPRRLVDKEVAKEFDSSDWGVVPDLEVAMNADQIEEALTLRLEADRLPAIPGFVGGGR